MSKRLKNVSFTKYSTCLECYKILQKLTNPAIYKYACIWESNAFYKLLKNDMILRRRHNQAISCTLNKLETQSHRFVFLGNFTRERHFVNSCHYYSSLAGAFRHFFFIKRKSLKSNDNHEYSAKLYIMNLSECAIVPIIGHGCVHEHHSNNIHVGMISMYLHTVLCIQLSVSYSNSDCSWSLFMYM